MKSFWPLFTIAVLLIAGLLFAIVLFLLRQPEVVFTEIEEDPTKPTLLRTDPIRGNTASAKAMLVVYSNFTCATCATLFEKLDALKELNSQGLVIVWKDYPNASIDPESRRASIAGRCAQEQNAFWPYHDRLFAAQQELGDVVYLGIAKEIGLQMGRFERCLRNEKTASLVDAGRAEAEKLELISAPTVFFGEERFTGDLSKASLETIIEPFLQ